MKDELMECPFCGGEARSNPRAFSDAEADIGNAYIECIECGVETPWRLTESEAIAAWNRRATPDPSSDLAEIAYEAARPHFHYAKKGTPDAHSFDRTQPAILLRKALPAIIAAVEPQIAAKAREDGRAAVMSARELAERIEALEAENARLREALHRIEDASYINQLQGTANFERLQNIARAALKGGNDEG